MHVVIFVDFHDSSVGGIQTSVRGQRKGLERLGHKVTIISPPSVVNAPEDPAIITIRPAPFVRPNGFPMVAPSESNMHLIEKQLALLDPIDIIHVQTSMGIGVMGTRIARKHSIPLVQTMHGRDDVFANTYPLPYISTMILRMLHMRHVPHKTVVHKLNDKGPAHNAWQVMVNQAQSGDTVVMPSHHFETKFREHGVTKPIEVISNGISDDVVAKLPRTLRPIAKKGTPLSVMWCGRLSPEKRPFESIEAVSRIEGCQLDLYGNGPLTSAVQAYIDDHGLSDRVRLKGAVDQGTILEAMQVHDVLLYPSFGFDNQPMVILEGVATGLPIIYCDPDLTECMPSGGGLLTDDTSIDAITKALSQLQASPSKRHEMHQKMHGYRDKITQSYHSKKMVKLYERLSKHK